MPIRAKLAWFLLWIPLSGLAQPRPGEIFRDYVYTNRFGELDAGNTRENLKHMRAGSLQERNLDIYDLGGATRAEINVEYWGGHIGTAGQRLRVNGSTWLDIPQPGNTPTPPQCYYRTLLGSASVPVPLEWLKRGRNVFHFTAGSQICHSFNWGFYWIYSFTVRVYYDPSALAKHALAAKITAPRDGAVVGDRPKFQVQAAGPMAAISRVDLIGHYKDFNWEGDGLFKRWHYITERGQLRHHIGSATSPPFEIEWDTTWIPDQPGPVRVLALVTDANGLTSVTPETSVTLARKGRSVKMYTASNVPEKFGVRKGAKMSCAIDIPNDVKAAKSARLVLSSWSAAHNGEISLNGTRLGGRFGVVHNYSFDSISFSPSVLRKGVNTFGISSNTDHHAAEVNWPGPVVFVEY